MTTCINDKSQLTHTGFTLPRELGFVFSTLSNAGMSYRDIDELVSSTPLFDILFSSKDIVLINSDSFALFGALVQCSPEVLNKISYNDFCNCMLHNNTDWLMSWTIETIMFIAKKENASIKEVLAVTSFETVICNSVRYHTFPPNVFYEDVFQPQQENASTPP